MLGPRPSRWGCGWHPENKLLCHICYHIKFRCSRSNHFSTDRRSLKYGNIGATPLKCRRGWPLRSPFLHHLCYRAKFGPSRSNDMSIINRDPAEKFDPSCPTFQGHSRSLELIQTDRLPVTSYQWFIVIMAICRTVSKINGDFGRKLKIFPT